VVAELAAGTLDTDDVVDWLAPRLRLRDRAATCAKEAPMRRWRPLVAVEMGMATMRRQPKGMFQRFTDRARRVVHLAQEEARLLRHNYVGTEHLLLGLLYEGEGIAARALGSLGISLEAVRARVEEIIGRGQTTPSGHIPFTPRAKKVLELSLREALQFGHNYIGTEHLLLGLLREGEGVAAQVLAGFGTDHARVRELVQELLTDVGELAGAETRLVQLSMPAELVDAAEQLAEVRRQKQAAFDTGDLDSATTLRDREKQLLADKLRLERQWTAGVDVQAVIEENQRVHRELERLRELLRQHGIDPNGGTVRTA
jgi:ATP-dependent Clp protease ATP-binding subunit ClpA